MARSNESISISGILYPNPIICHEERHDKQRSRMITTVKKSLSWSCTQPEIQGSNAFTVAVDKAIKKGLACRHICTELHHCHSSTVCPKPQMSVQNNRNLAPLLLQLCLQGISLPKLLAKICWTDIATPQFFAFWWIWICKLAGSEAGAWFHC